jgi:hypothetical protein
LCIAFLEFLSPNWVGFVSSTGSVHYLRHALPDLSEARNVTEISIFRAIGVIQVKIITYRKKEPPAAMNAAGGSKLERALAGLNITG